VVLFFVQICERYPNVTRSVGLRVTPEEERMGLDLSQHNERAYS